MTVKQVLVIRKDLRMRRGKEIAQGSHASMKFLAEKLREGCTVSLSPAELEWFEGKFAKITTQVNSEKELLDLHERARQAGLTSWLILDSGLTEFGGVPTYTCLAIGPDYSEKIDPITGHLPLY